MSAVCGSAECSPTKNLPRNDLVGRDSVESAGSETAKKRLLSRAGEPLFYAKWDNVVFIHYETEPQELQSCVPYDLVTRNEPVDSRIGAIVSIIAQHQVTIFRNLDRAERAETAHSARASSIWCDVSR